MKKYFTNKAFVLFSLIGISVNQIASAQASLEWRLSNQTYSATDPDGLGPATGSVTFTLQIHTISATIPSVTALTLGYSYQSSKAMIPTTTNCLSATTPPNTAISSEFVTGGFVYESVEQCFTSPVEKPGKL